jgi:hypothetical protein
MIVLEKIDYDGDDLLGDLKKLDEIHSRIQQKVGGKIEGPYLPQDASLLYIIHIDKFESLNQAGRFWIEEMSRAKLPFAPKSYEIAVTPKEFFG